MPDCRCRMYCSTQISQIFTNAFSRCQHFFSLKKYLFYSSVFAMTHFLFCLENKKIHLQAVTKTLFRFVLFSKTPLRNFSYFFKNTQIHQKYTFFTFFRNLFHRSLESLVRSKMKHFHFLGNNTLLENPFLIRHET